LDRTELPRIFNASEGYKGYAYVFEFSFNR